MTLLRCILLCVVLCSVLFLHRAPAGKSVKLQSGSRSSAVFKPAYQCLWLSKYFNILGFFFFLVYDIFYFPFPNQENFNDEFSFFFFCCVSWLVRRFLFWFPLIWRPLCTRVHSVFPPLYSEHSEYSVSWESALLCWHRLCLRIKALRRLKS